MLTRRTFVTSAAAMLLQPKPPTTRPNLAEIDRIRILAAASVAVANPPKPDADLQSPAFLAFTLAIPALAAAQHIAPDPTYTATAKTLLEAWFLNPATRPTLTFGATEYEALIALAPLAELAVALPFLPFDPAFTARIRTSFRSYLDFLITDRTALLARDSKSHHASAWLLQVSAFARLYSDETLVAECRHRFRSQTLRAQIQPDGLFPAELRTTNPFRNSLFNLDLLAGVCQLLSNRFESVWEAELADGPGMRVAIARHALYLGDPRLWPYPSDAEHFHLLPGRRPALVFAARAYQRADYVQLWNTLNPDPTDPSILRTFPIRQPILWLSEPRRRE